MSDMDVLKKFVTDGRPLPLDANGLKEFVVTVRGTATEQYVVMARDEDHAREIWSDEDPVHTEVDDASVTGVEEVE